jgi:hypothetical protein
MVLVHCSILEGLSVLLGLRIPKSVVQRSAEGYVGGGLIATHGDDFYEAVADGKHRGVTVPQRIALEKLVLDSGVMLTIKEDGSISVD